MNHSWHLPQLWSLSRGLARQLQCSTDPVNFSCQNLPKTIDSTGFENYWPKFNGYLFVLLLRPPSLPLGFSHCSGRCVGEGTLHTDIFASLEDSSHNKGWNTSICRWVYSALPVPVRRYNHLTLVNKPRSSWTHTKDVSDVACDGCPPNSFPTYLCCLVTALISGYVFETAFNVPRNTQPSFPSFLFCLLLAPPLPLSSS